MLIYPWLFFFGKEPKGTKILLDKDIYFREKTGEIMNIN